MMKERLQYVAELASAGMYQVRGLIASLTGLAAAGGILVALDPSLLPKALLPFQDHIHDLGKWALLVATIAGAVAAQSKPVLPKPPAEPEQPQ